MEVLRILYFHIRQSNHRLLAQTEQPIGRDSWGFFAINPDGTQKWKLNVPAPASGGLDPQLVLDQMELCTDLCQRSF